MNFKIRNCNNIDSADINIEENMLNIKYAMNGTGKSTIGKAIEGSNIASLVPFGTNNQPTIESDKPIKAVLFNEEFINNIVFKGNSVIENSFEVFIKSDKYDEKRENIDKTLKNLKTDIFENEDLSILFDKLSLVCSIIPYEKDKHTIYKRGAYKSLLQKNNIFNVPIELLKFSDFISDRSNNTQWVDWKLKGFAFDKKNKCPFCAEDFNSNYEQEKKEFQDTYKKSDVKNLNEIENVLNELSEYFNSNEYDKLEKCIKFSDSEEEINMVFTKFMSETNFLLDKLNKVKDFDSYQVNKEDISKLSQIVAQLKINKDNLTFYNAPKTYNLLDEINSKIDELLGKIQVLKEEIGSINGFISDVIKKSKKEINEFLNLAGFNYEIDIIPNGSEKDTKTILKYINKENQKIEVDDISSHLSWGERNAFALVLFMYYSLKQGANIIILDDPISSFDGTKKYAIINRLFENRKDKNSFFGKTVIMLTHDFEPIIDFGINQKPNGNVKISYLKNNNGNVTEKEIDPNNDVKSILDVYYENINNDKLNIISKINFLRKYIEYTNVEKKDQKFLAYSILSSIIHGTNLTKKVHNEYIELTEDEIKSGEEYIKHFINDFDSKKILSNINDNYILNLYNKEENNYVKTQLFRMYLERSNNKTKTKDKVLLKFTDEIYHIENDYIFSLNLIKFDTIPSYIIAKMDAFMKQEMEDK